MMDERAKVIPTVKLFHRFEFFYTYNNNKTNHTKIKKISLSEYNTRNELLAKYFHYLSLECDGFSYGKTCENTCNCGQGASTCDKEKGCVCLAGWTGDKCDLDKDECAASNPCTGDHQICQNSIGSYNCICETGFNHTGGICIGMHLTTYDCTEFTCMTKIYTLKVTS